MLGAAVGEPSAAGAARTVRKGRVAGPIALKIEAVFNAALVVVILAWFYAQCPGSALN